MYHLRRMAQVVASVRWNVLALIVSHLLNIHHCVCAFFYKVKIRGTSRFSKVNAHVYCRCSFSHVFLKKKILNCIALAEPSIQLFHLEHTFWQLCRSFGPYAIDLRQIFFESKLTYGLVNLKPIVPNKPSLSAKEAQQQVLQWSSVLSLLPKSDAWLFGLFFCSKVVGYKNGATLRRMSVTNSTMRVIE